MISGTNYSSSSGLLGQVIFLTSMLLLMYREDEYTMIIWPLVYSHKGRQLLGLLFIVSGVKDRDEAAFMRESVCI